MELDFDACLRAMRCHDTRFDGKFFVGIASTRIYCRPICPSRPAARKNIAFYPSAAAAEKAGLRPCLRCRPELAPGSAPVDSARRLAAAAAERIGSGALNELTLTDVASEVGIGTRHLRRVVVDEFGVAPVELAQTHRLLAAKHLLTDTSLGIGEIALASGFGSLRRFNALFLERYRLSPSAFRKDAGGRRSADSISFRLSFRPPLDWEAMLSFLVARAAADVESIDRGVYARSVGIGEYRGWLTAERDESANQITVRIPTSLTPVFVPIVARVKRLFDLSASPDSIAGQLGALAAQRPGLRVPGAFDAFEVAVRAILGQQVSVRTATAFACRFAHVFGEPIETPICGVCRLSPSVEAVASATVDQIASIGIVRSRAATIGVLAKALADRSVRLDPGAPPEQTMAALTRLPGIGDWTAQYIAMRCLSWPDAFPHTDLALVKAMPGRSESQRLAEAEAWRPWRAYAAMHLWRSLASSENATT